MTQVKVICKGNKIIGFEMLGHAGYNVGGPDILCASLSAVSQLTINGIINWLHCSSEAIIKVDNPKEGHLKVIVPDDFFETLYKREVVQQFLIAFELYIKQLSGVYGDYVKLERRQYNGN